jgi:hypothetical protein
MATPPYAKVLVALNGVPVGSGGITVSGGDVVQLSPESTVGWRLQRWEITDAPPGFSAPAGWNVASDGSFYSTAVQPPTFTIPSVGSTTWGKYAVRLRVNGNPLLLDDAGIRNPAYQSTLTDESTMLSLLSSAGVEGIALGEDRQFDTRRGWLGALMRMARTLAASGGGGGGGGGSSIPTPTLPNAVVQISTSGVITSAPLRWDQILAAWSINSFGIVQASPVEVGTTLTTPSFTASYSSTPTSAILTDNNGTAARDVTSTPTSFASLGTFTKTANGASVTWTLSAHDATSSTLTRTTSVTWYPRLRWGVGAAGQTGASFINALGSSALAGSRAGTFSATPGSTQKIYYACPTAYGTASFSVGGFSGGFTRTQTGVSVTNSLGVTMTYDLYESDNLNLGATTFVVS